MEDKKIDIIMHFKDKSTKKVFVNDCTTPEELIESQSNNITQHKLLCFNNTIYNFNEIKYVEFKEVNDGK